jgi:hypothetical protein
VVASNLKIVDGNGIIALVDIEIVAWRLVLRGCRWRKDAEGERITTGPCDSIGFSDDRITRRFQAAALTAVHDLARQVVKP